MEYFSFLLEEATDNAATTNHNEECQTKEGVGHGNKRKDREICRLVTVFGAGSIVIVKSAKHRIDSNVALNIICRNIEIIHFERGVCGNAAHPRYFPQNIAIVSTTYCHANAFQNTEFPPDHSPVCCFIHIINSAGDVPSTNCF